VTPTPPTTGRARSTPARAPPAARHAVSLAKLDAEAREAGVPLAAYLADDPADTVTVNATVGDASAADTADAVRNAADAGFETVKVKVGARSLDEDVERLRAAHDETDATLRADANGAWSRERAREAFDRLRDFHVSYVEQPLSADDLEGTAAWVRKTASASRSTRRWSPTSSEPSSTRRTTSC